MLRVFCFVRGRSFLSLDTRLGAKFLSVEKSKGYENFPFSEKHSNQVSGLKVHTQYKYYPIPFIPRVLTPIFILKGTPPHPYAWCMTFFTLRPPHQQNNFVLYWKKLFAHHACPQHFFHRNLAVWHKHIGDVIYYVAIIPSLGIAMILFVLTAGVLMKWVIFTALIFHFISHEAFKNVSMKLKNNFNSPCVTAPLGPSIPLGSSFFLEYLPGTACGTGRYLKIRNARLDHFMPRKTKYVAILGTVGSTLGILQCHCWGVSSTIVSSVTGYHITQRSLPDAGRKNWQKSLSPQKEGLH